MWRAVIMLTMLTSASSLQAQWKIQKVRSTTASAERSAKPVETSGPALRLNDFHAIEGTTFLMASMTRGHHENWSKMSSSSSSGGIANYVVFDTTNDTAISVVPENDRTIVSCDFLSSSGIVRRWRSGSDESSERARSADTKSLARWLLLEMEVRERPQDTKGQPVERTSIAIADVSGEGFSEVLHDAGDIFSREVLDGETLLLIHGNQTSQVATRVRLSDRKIVSSKSLPNFGSR